jgi:hypothetical protein
MSVQASASRPVVASGATGSICKKTGPYVYDNGFLKIVVFVKRGDPFPPAPTDSAPSAGSNTRAQRANVTWSMVGAGG